MSNNELSSETLLLLGLNSDQMYNLMMEREKTKQLELLTSQILEKKRKFCSEDFNVQKKMKFSQDICDDVWINIMEFLPGGEGFRMMFISKRLMALTKYLKAINFSNKNMFEQFLNSNLMKPQIQHIKTSNFGISHNLFEKLILNSCNNLKSLNVTLENKSKECLFIRNNVNTLKRLETLTICGFFKLKIFSILCSLKVLNIQHATVEKASDVLNRFTRNIQIFKVYKLEHFDVNPKIELPNLKVFQVHEITCNLETAVSFFEIETLNHFNSNVYLEPKPTQQEISSMTRQMTSNLTCLTLHSKKLFNIVFNFKLEKLSRLTLFSKLYQEHAELIANNQSLSTLKSLTVCNLTNSQYKALSESPYLTNLTQLDVNYYDDEDIVSHSKCLKYLSKSKKSFKKLKSIELSGSEKVDMEIFSNSDQFSDLTSLAVGPKIRTLHHFVKSSKFPNLKVLQLYSVKKLPNEIIEQLCNNESFSNLVHLEAVLNDEQVELIVNSKHLKLKSLKVCGELLTCIGANLLQSLACDCEIDFF